MNKVQCCDTGRHLEKKQMPDGEKKAETPSTLKPEQTPDIAESIDSDMVAKSHGPVRKEASKEAADEEPKEAPKEAPAEEPKEAPKEAPAEEPKTTKSQELKEKRKEDKAEDTQEDATDKAEQAADALKDLEKMTKKEASDSSETLMVFEGIELTAPMADVELTAQDIETLGRLF